MAILSRWLIACALLAPVLPALADDVASEDVEVSNGAVAYEDRIAELERTVRVLAEELERTRTEVAVPEEADLKSAYGMGPAASKVYGLTRGLSIGGYGEGFYRRYVTDRDSTTDTADMLRGVLYVGYKFNERIIFNSEIEFEHATTGSTATSSGGSASVEFAQLDFMWKDYANARVGLLLQPLGWLNLIHEPPFYFGVTRPDVERQIIPSTWRSNGAGLFGNLGEQLDYKLYVTTGLNGAGYDSKGVRGGRQKGNRENAENLSFSGRLDWTPTPGLILGGSFFTGNSGLNQDFASESVADTMIALPDARTTIWDLHGQWNWKGLHLRSLFTMAHIADARQLTLALRDIDGGIGSSEAIAETMIGGYAEIAYDIWGFLGSREDGHKTLEPFYRFEMYDTQWKMPSGFSADQRREVMVHTVGLQYEPIPNVVIKTDYRNRSAKEGKIADEFNIGFGYVF